MLAARSAVTSIRLRSHHPRQYSDKGASLPKEEKDMLFRLALKIIQYDNLLHSSNVMQVFRWHIKVRDSNICPSFNLFQSIPETTKILAKFNFFVSIYVIHIYNSDLLKVVLPMARIHLPP